MFIKDLNKLTILSLYWELMLISVICDLVFTESTLFHILAFIYNETSLRLHQRIQDLAGNLPVEYNYSHESEMSQTQLESRDCLRALKALVFFNYHICILSLFLVFFLQKISPCIYVDTFLYVPISISLPRSPEAVAF